jgi:hypothetical protein
MAQHERATPPNIAPLVCHRCGVIAPPGLTQGSGPHALRANCRSCGSFIQWISKYSPAEREARRTAGRYAAMAKQPPTELQLRFLYSLGHNQAPANKAEASVLIDRLLAEKHTTLFDKLGK